MKIEYACVCGTKLVVTRSDRKPVDDLADMWRQHSQCPALWARWGHVDQTADTAEVRTKVFFPEEDIEEAAP
jgi:hypothetical protein